MRQRLGLAAALLRRPRLLLLDEPTNGLDPGGMRDMRGLVANLASDGLTVLLSSHLMPEVEQLCSELAIIARGRIRFAGTLEELRAGHGGHDYRLRVTDPALAARSSAYVPGVDVEIGDSGELLVRADEDGAARLTVALGRAGIGIYSMVADTPSLEGMFFDLTEDPDDDPAARTTADAGTAA
jgi:ABC-2 type transport system ATP-binding protein